MARNVSFRRDPLGRRGLNKVARKWVDFRLGRRKAAYRRQQGPAQESLAAFVVGCQRSGTDMTIKTLDHSMDVERFDEYDVRAFCDCRIRGKEIRDDLVERSQAKCALFKPVCDSHRVGEVLAEHPGSRAIWVYRDFRDVANSAVARWGDTTQRFIEDLLDGGGQWGRMQWNRERVTDETVKTMRGAAVNSLTPHAAACLFWLMRNQTFFDQNLGNRTDVMLARYESLVQKPEPEFERLCRHLDIMFEPAVVAEVRHGSIRKNPFPGVDPKIESLCENILDRLDRLRSRGQRTA